MPKRKIIEIDRDLCNGCGLCTTACAEGALALDEKNKAVLVREIYCDGLGACLDVCPTGALTVVERESDGYDAAAAYRHVLRTRGEEAAGQVHGAGASGGGERKAGAAEREEAAGVPMAAATGDRAAEKAPGPTGAPRTGATAKQGKSRDADAARVSPGRRATGSRGAASAATAAGQSKAGTLACGCPGSAAQVIKRKDPPAGTVTGTGHGISGASELRQWPIQLHLVSPYAPYFREAELLIAADCTAFSLGSFHQDLLKGKMLMIACPKLDATEGYVDKLADLIRENRPKSITVAIMTVPCCSGLFRMVEEAVRLSGTGLPLERRLIHIDGQIVA
jgi:NAD-dependent dihydropyrimidine dehydrogenase PreA subunit